MFKRMLAISLGVIAGLSALGAQPPAPPGAKEREPGGKVARGRKADLTPESFPTIHTLVRPQENEWRHLKVQWLTDVVAARQKAVAEDKPIVICYTGGAGYNEPLGIC